MKIYAGTSGYDYKEWKGIFYPPHISPHDMLGFYARKLNAVEINYTFYHMPTSKLLEGWATHVEEGFRFSIKAPQVITHRKRLKDVGEEARYFFGVLGNLGKRLGAVLFQFPPSFHLNRQRLEEFLRLIPATVPCAFEFRSPTWIQPEILELLRNAGCSLCTADSSETPSPGIVPTASWGYLRLRRQDYDEVALRSWLEAIRVQKWERAFVFFKHEDDARGPGEALRIMEMAGQG